VLRTLPNDLTHNRYGFVTSKRVGGAVVRNRVRRRLGESIRRLPILPGHDLVFSAKTDSAAADYHELNRAVVDLLAKADLLEDRTQEGETL
jgi:ribonuclease P protein component